MYTGTVFLWAEWGEFGCIKCDQLEESNIVSVSIHDIVKNFEGEYPRLESGGRISFDLEKNEHGYKAINVVRIKEGEQTE